MRTPVSAIQSGCHILMKQCTQKGLTDMQMVVSSIFSAVETALVCNISTRAAWILLHLLDSQNGMQRCNSDRNLSPNASAWLGLGLGLGLGIGLGLGLSHKARAW